MTPQPIAFKRNPVTRSRVTNLMILVLVLSIGGLNESNIESLEPALFIGTLVMSVAVLMRLSRRNQRYYLQILGDSLMINHSLFWTPQIYDISGLSEVKRGLSPVPGRKPLVIATSHGVKIRLSTFWLTEADLSRIQKILQRRLK